ncbi:CamS family sex pheromone protein [Aciduricibacillus chroicocephali]|uniref:CamS family sex pheromone protein n=1 Tax=Aciduricibacillus chroicocephali TaxID=3054939 RepID=A0ABY9KXE6_9BACI|nr:CamS family sex pheromone protein [Bacillaceae bacterium 44XB]
MKKAAAILLSVLLLASCAPNKNDELVQNKDSKEKKETPSIVPSYQLSDSTYKIILPFRPSKARGVIDNQIANRVDIDELEEGLKRHSTDEFSPDDYYFEEGQYLTEDMVYDWLGRNLTKKQIDKEVKETADKKRKEGYTVDEQEIRDGLQNGLNPPIAEDAKEKDYRDHPRYLSHILEQDYLRKKDDDTVELAGISIGLALKSVYRFQTEIGGPYYYEKIPKAEMEKNGKEIAQKVVDRVRKIKGLKNVPIVIALYREEAQDSPVAGDFVSKTIVDEGETQIGKWNKIDEKHVLFPSDNAKKNHFDDNQAIKSFGDDIAKYFPNYVGIVGEGFYVNKDLQRLTIRVPIEFYGKSEVTGFTQYAYGLIQEKFPEHYDLEVQISSNEKLESLITREKGDKKPVVHILH